VTCDKSSGSYAKWEVGRRKAERGTFRYYLYAVSAAAASNQFRAAKFLCVLCSTARFARKNIERSEKIITHHHNLRSREPSGKAEGGKGNVSVLSSFCKCSSGFKPISRSAIPLRALLHCALCEKKY
jgi:hypothetical protein